MAYTTIKKPSDYFNTKLYTGNGTSQSVTGVGFQPDLIWVKERSSTSSHQLVDAVRGVYRRLIPNGTNAESDDSGSPNDFNSFDSDGFSILAGGAVNENSQTYAAWNWLANNTSGSSNTDGSITSTVSANTTSGFSIVTYSGNSTAGSTFGHGLGVKPSMIITKARTRASMWNVYHKGLTNYTKGIYLNATDAEFDGGAFADGEPNANTFTLSNGTHVNGSGETYVAYCFAEKQGYSKFGSYTGNGSTDGTFVYTGFKPAFVIIKKTDGADNWTINDNKRVGYNVDNNELFANLSNAEDTNDVLDLLSNGFKLRHTAGRHNTSGGTYIYMCFAESPFVTSSGIPTCAR